MTDLQVKYWALEEEKRANKEQEALKARANEVAAYEATTHRLGQTSKSFSDYIGTIINGMNVGVKLDEVVAGTAMKLIGAIMAAI